MLDREKSTNNSKERRVRRASLKARRSTRARKRRAIIPRTSNSETKVKGSMRKRFISRMRRRKRRKKRKSMRTIRMTVTLSLKGITIW